jgi:PAS domain S-box-containing protein
MGEIMGEEVHLYWQSVVDTMAEGLFIVDPRGVVVFMNPAAERITGYSRQEALGRPCSIFESDTCLSCTIEGGRLACGLFEEGRVENKRCLVRHKDRRYVHLLKNARVLLDVHGQVIGGVETLTDITELVNKDRQIKGLRAELKRSYGFEGLLGESKVMGEVFELLRSAAQAEAPVVILGESGTGKELAAAAIHRRSQRAQGPFIKVNCAALNLAILESELFGHEKGAFTGADRQRKGRFEAAHGGTLFLDEVGDLPPSVQVKLLRVLQEGEIERVGSQEPVKVDVRIVTATNQDLAQAMASGRFREDLFYRINVIPVHLPPLRQRLEDIPLMVETFLERLSLRSNRPITGISRAALDRLMAYSWPGNVRELLNALEYAFVTCREGQIEPRHLPPSVLGLAEGRVGHHVQAVSTARATHGEEQQRAELETALAAAGGHKAKAAQILGISRVTLWKRLKRAGMVDER